MFRIRMCLLILQRLHLWSAFSSQCWKIRALPFPFYLHYQRNKSSMCHKKKKKKNKTNWDSKDACVIFPQVTDFSIWWVLLTPWFTRHLPWLPPGSKALSGPHQQTKPVLKSRAGSETMPWGDRWGYHLCTGSLLWCWKSSTQIKHRAVDRMWGFFAMNKSECHKEIRSTLVTEDPTSFHSRASFLQKL